MRSQLRKPYVVLGIESSCDDTAVAIISSDRKMLASRIYSDKIVQRRLGGISPLTSATVGRTVIDRLVDECLDESNIRLSDLDAIAVTTRPGLLLSLKAVLLGHDSNSSYESTCNRSSPS
uniref:N(6)-L-threonylcarbamoyladenine synthase n=1 Tax=Acrobeloides nanus TaxID=290746 RepID=A0A914BV93_9BILA